MSRARNYRKAMAAALLSSTDGGCAYCGTELDESTVQVDHVDPFGPDCASNYLPSCRSCNSTKGRKSLPEFRAYVESFRALDAVPEELGLNARQLGWLLDQEWFPIKRARHAFPFELVESGE